MIDEPWVNFIGCVEEPNREEKVAKSHIAE
jgi:hypothetical protein